MKGLLSIPVKAGRFAVKHPLLTAGAAGAGVVGYGTMQHAKAEEQAIRDNYAGAPMGKYVFAELERFEERKGYLNEKLAFEKVAVVFRDEMKSNGGIAWAPTIGADLSGGFGKAVGQETIGGLASLLGSVADSLRNKIVLAPKREAIFAHLIQNDPVIAQYEASQPGSAARAYMSMSRFAPELSTDPNVVTSFLRETAQTGVTLNHVTIKQLAEAEAAIQAATGRGGRR